MRIIIVTDTEESRPEGPHMDELTISELAELNGISRKSLLVYHEKGLIKPVRIDEESGYRYYTVGQSYDVEQIQQLQDMGASLAQICHVLECDDPAALADLAREREQALSDQIDQLRLARYNARQIVARHERIPTLPPPDTVVLEHIEARNVLEFPIETDEAVPISGTEGPCIDVWEEALCYAKRRMAREGIPRELFQNIGMRIGHGHANGQQRCILGVLLFIKSPGLAREFDTQILPEGLFLTVHKTSYFGTKGNTEYQGIAEIAAIAEQHGFTLAGDCIEEVLQTRHAPNAQGRDALFKLQIPVAVQKA